MPMIDGLPQDILNAVVARLIAQLSLPSERCFISDDPNASPPSSGEIYYVVSPGPKGSFDPAMFTGGGNDMATVNTMIIVTIHNTSQQDEAEKAKLMFNDASRGLFALAKGVIKALGEWTPPKSSDIIVNQPLYPDNYTWYRNSRDSATFQIAFHVQFDWDLS